MVTISDFVQRGGRLPGEVPQSQFESQSEIRRLRQQEAVSTLQETGTFRPGQQAMDIFESGLGVGGLLTAEQRGGSGIVISSRQATIRGIRQDVFAQFETLATDKFVRDENKRITELQKKIVTEESKKQFETGQAGRIESFLAKTGREKQQLADIFEASDLAPQISEVVTRNGVQTTIRKRFTTKLKQAFTGDSKTFLDVTALTMSPKGIISGLRSTFKDVGNVIRNLEGSGTDTGLTGDILKGTESLVTKINIGLRPDSKVPKLIKDISGVTGKQVFVIAGALNVVTAIGTVGLVTTAAIVGGITTTCLGAVEVTRLIGERGKTRAEKEAVKQAPIATEIAGIIGESESRRATPGVGITKILDTTPAKIIEEILGFSRKGDVATSTRRVLGSLGVKENLVESIVSERQKERVLDLASQAVAAIGAEIGGEASGLGLITSRLSAKASGIPASQIRAFTRPRITVAALTEIAVADIGSTIGTPNVISVKGLFEISAVAAPVAGFIGSEVAARIGLGQPSGKKLLGAARFSDILEITGDYPVEKISKLLSGTRFGVPVPVVTGGTSPTLTLQSNINTGVTTPIKDIKVSNLLAGSSVPTTTPIRIKTTVTDPTVVPAISQVTTSTAAPSSILTTTPSSVLTNMLSITTTTPVPSLIPSLVPTTISTPVTTTITTTIPIIVPILKLPPLPLLLPPGGGGGGVRGKKKRGRKGRLSRKQPSIIGVLRGDLATITGSVPTGFGIRKIPKNAKGFLNLRTPITDKLLRGIR